MARKPDLKQVDAVARWYGLDRKEFGDYIGKCKAKGDFGTENDRGDFTWDELREKVEEYKNQ